MLNANLSSLGCSLLSKNRESVDLRELHKRHQVPLPTSLAGTLSEVKETKENLKERNPRIDFLPGRLWRRGRS